MPGISRNSHYDWLGGRETTRELANRALAGQMTGVYAAKRASYCTGRLAFWLLALAVSSARALAPLRLRRYCCPVSVPDWYSRGRL